MSQFGRNRNNSDEVKDQEAHGRTLMYSRHDINLIILNIISFEVDCGGQSYAGLERCELKSSKRDFRKNRFSQENLCRAKGVTKISF